MSMGQGATMALPIWAYYMRRVYANSQLGYNENAVFELDEGYNPCVLSDSGIEENDIEDVYE